MKVNGTQLTYYGKVNIKVGKKTYSNYNEGKPKLFELFARFLCGNKIDNVELPTFINVVRRDTISGESKQVPIINQILNITKQFKRDASNNQIAVITTSIVDSNLISSATEGTGDSKYYLILLNESLDELAEIQIEESIISQISTGRQALIEWSLYITNKNEGESIQ